MVSGEKLRWQFLPVEDAERLYLSHPEIKGDPDKYCPTCNKDGHYIWNGKEEVCDCQLQLQLTKHYYNSGIGTVYQRLSWEDYHGDPKGRELCEKYLENAKALVNRGTGLIFIGVPGVGKTLAINLLLKDLLKSGFKCYSTTFTDMVEMFTAGWKSEDDQKLFQEKVRNSQILFLDDLGREQRTRTNLAETTFDSVLRFRVQNAKPTFLTTNLSVKELGVGYGSAVLSLLKEVNLVHEFSGEDFRDKANSRMMEEIFSGNVRPVM